MFVIIGKYNDGGVNLLSKFLISYFVKDYKDKDNDKVRESYGYLAGIVGISLNFLLFMVKLMVGIMTKSIAVTADAFNNLSDTASSIITLLGFKLASIPADEEHPFGHGRIEYLSGLVVSVLVVLVGFEFAKTSFLKILHPSGTVFEMLPFVLLVLSIGVKIWLSRFNKYVGDSINSSALQASSLDSLTDVIISTSAAISLILSRWVKFPIDSYAGLFISLFILYTGFRLIKDTLDPILGEAPSHELVKNIISGVLDSEYISGVHDLIIHNYGPGRTMASIHAEVPSDISLVKIHEVIDKIERDVSDKLNIYLIIHIDPINHNDKEVENAKRDVLLIIKKYPNIKSIHDFRVVGEGEEKNLIFDVVIDLREKMTQEKSRKLKENLAHDIKSIHPNYNLVLTIDREFTNM